MTLSVAKQAELIPGYRLLERLGQGGFGEVWKAEAPGGLLKAVKIVHGSIHSAEGIDDGAARQELKALERVKTVRHPFILSLERFDIVDGQLVIVMELADRNLADRFKECRAQQLPGVPREELLGYVEEAAEALDLMNIQFQLQHLDIKPQNLFLVHNHVKVADFGLVKDLEGIRTRATSGMTALYAPPETFEGLVSRYCDQYNLAIVYQELLTGRLPFSGTSPRQLMLQHLTVAPNLDALPAGDREAIARALSKKPEDRFPTCGDLVRALRENSQPSDEKQMARAGPRPVPVVPPPAHRRVADKPDSRTALLRPSPRTPAATPTATPPVPQAVPPAPTECTQVTGDGVLFPALVIGLGVAGREVLRQLRKALHKRCGPADVLPNVRFLLLDADPDELSQATEGESETALTDRETLLTRLQRPAQYLRHGRERLELEQWMPMGMLQRLPREQTTPGGWRALGRLAFATNFPAINARLLAELEACRAPEALEAAAKNTGLGKRTNWPRVYVVASLGGGTGGGMFLDVAYAVRNRLRQLGFSRPDVVGLFLLPAVDRAGAGRQATANAFASLTELAHYSAPETVFAAGYSDQGQTLVDSAAPFGRCVLLPLPKEEVPASLQELAALAGDFLGRDLVTPFGRAADEARGAWGAGRGSAEAASRSKLFSTFGSYWFAVPRRLLLQRVARSVCHSLIQGWRAEDPNGAEGVIQEWIAGQLEQGQLGPEQLAAALEEACTAALGGSPLDRLDEVLDIYAAGRPADLRRSPELAAEAVQAVIDFVGPSSGGPAAAAAAALGRSLAGCVARVAAALEPRLAEVAHRVLAEPHFRLLGVEEIVQARVGETLARQARHFQAEAAKASREAAAVYPQALPLVDTLRRGSFLGLGVKGRTSELLEVLRRYGAVRCRALLLQLLAALHQELNAIFQQYLIKVGCCRRRIAQFLKHFEDVAGGRQPHVDLGLGQYLLPAGCRTLTEAVSKILDALTDDELREINGRVQALIGQKFGAQVHVCTAPAHLFKDLEEEILREVTAFAEAPLGRAQAAELYLQQGGQEANMLAELSGAFDQAAPELFGARLAAENEFCVVAVPPGPEGDHFNRLVRRAVSDRQLIRASGTDDIVFYREVPRLALADLPQLGPAAQEAYRQALAAEQMTPHARTDVAEWLPVS